MGFIKDLLRRASIDALSYPKVRIIIPNVKPVSHNRFGIQRNERFSLPVIIILSSATPIVLNRSGLHAFVPGNADCTWWLTDLTLYL